MQVEQADVVVVGGGPAGLAAATALRAGGVGSVVLLERDAQCGGAAGHCGHRTFGLREAGRLLTGSGYADRLVAAALGSGVEIRTHNTVRSIEDGPLLDVLSPGGRTRIAASRVVLATGAREMPRSARMVSGSRPLGVLSTGALQEYLYRERLLPFRRPVVVGTELVGLSSLLTCRKHGIRPVAVIESAPQPLARWPFTLFPRLLGIPRHLGAQILDIEGEHRVEAVVIRDRSGQTRRIECDGIIFTGRFVPEWTLAATAGLLDSTKLGALPVDQFGRTSNRRIFAAGNGVRAVETAAWCWMEGRKVAACVMEDLAGRLPTPETGTTVEIGPGLRFVTPSRIWPVVRGLGSSQLQLRLFERFRGRLVVRQQGRTIWHRALNSTGERRLLIPIGGLLPFAPGGTLTVTLEPGGLQAPRSSSEGEPKRPLPTRLSTEALR